MPLKATIKNKDTSKYATVAILAKDCEDLKQKLADLTVFLHPGDNIAIEEIADGTRGPTFPLNNPPPTTNATECAKAETPAPVNIYSVMTDSSAERQFLLVKRFDNNGTAIVGAFNLRSSAQWAAAALNKLYAEEQLWYGNVKV